MCKDQVGGLRQETFPHWACLQDNHIARPAMKPHQSGWAVKDHLEMLGITAGLRMRVLMCFPYYFCTYSVKFGGGKHPCFSASTVCASLFSLLCGLMIPGWAQRCQVASITAQIQNHTFAHCSRRWRSCKNEMARRVSFFIEITGLVTKGIEIEMSNH